MKEGYKLCPYCGEEIQDIAKKCRYCGERLEIKKGFKKEIKTNEQSTKKKEKNGFIPNKPILEYGKSMFYIIWYIFFCIMGFLGFIEMVMGKYDFWAGIIRTIIGIISGLFIRSLLKSKLFLSEDNIRYHKQPIFGKVYDLIIKYEDIIGYNPGSWPMHHLGIYFDLKNGQRIYIDNLYRNHRYQILQFMLQKYYENRLGVKYIQPK